jgi:hypothetical protein
MTPEQIFDQDKSLNINAFEIGDRVVRVERAPFKQTTYNENLGIEVEVIKHSDGSYLGDEMEFLGIFNRQICLRQIKPWLGDGITKLHIDQWQDGWQKYIIPNFEINK